jgi:hypothetical protein
MDVVSVEEDAVSGIADVLILQTKNSNSFSSTALTLLGNGLSWVFEKRKSQYQGLRNIPLVRKIDEVRELRNRSGPSNMVVRVFFGVEGRIFTFDIYADSEVDTHVILAKHSRRSVAIRFPVG